jgi:hypothetical protein
MHQRLTTAEILRRWVSSLCGSQSSFALIRAKRNHQLIPPHQIAQVVRLCAMHWLQITRQRRQSALRHRLFSPSSIPCRPRQVNPTQVSQMVLLAHAPPRRLSSELLQGVISCGLDLHEASYSLVSPPPLTSPPQTCPAQPSSLSPSNALGAVSSERIAELESLVEDLFQKISRGDCGGIDSSQRQEFAELLAEYAELIEELRVSGD